MLYDLKLEQFGLKRNPGESFSSYFRRVESSPIWNESKNVSLWDLSPDGAKELNNRVAHYNDVYYFSFQTSSTYRGLFGRQYPIVSTFVALQPFALFMGSYTRSGVPGRVDIDSSWWENDAVVNSRSMKAPAGAAVFNYSSGMPSLGGWNFMGKLDNWDHLDVTGLFTLRDINPLYVNHARLLRSLVN